MQMQSKGISPLIAAVLLIAFTIAIGVIVSTWSTTFTRDQVAGIETKSKTAVKCSESRFYFSNDSIVANGTRFTVRISNEGNVNLTNFLVYVTDKNNTLVSFTNITNSNSVAQPGELLELFNTSTLNKTSIKDVEVRTGPSDQCPGTHYKVTIA
jgi:flagellin-like protein